jgi:formate hydrogenlyase transcriptional activator
LVRYFVQKFCTRLKRHIVSIPSSSLAALQQWHWPGNIRELENVIERAVILSTGDVLQIPPFQLPSASETAPAAPAAVTSVPLSVVTSFAEGEREMILRALREADGVVAGPDGAAARLGIKRTTLQSKMRKLGIRRPSF